MRPIAAYVDPISLPRSLLESLQRWALNRIYRGNAVSDVHTKRTCGGGWSIV